MKNLYAVIFAGLPHIYRDYKDKPVDEVAAEVNQVCTEIEALLDLLPDKDATSFSVDHTPEVEATCRAAFSNKDMFYVADMYWLVYDQQRDDGNIPPATEGTWEP